MSLFARLPLRIRKWLFFGGVGLITSSVLLLSGYSFLWWNRVGQVPDIGDPFDARAWLQLELADEQNAATVYRQAFLLMGKATAPLPDGTPLWDGVPDHPVANESQFLDATELFYQFIRQASAMPNALILRPAEVGPFSFLAEENFAMRDACRILQVRSRILRSRGQFADALDNLTDMVSMARHFGHQGTFDQQRVANAVESIGLEELCKWAGDPGVDAQLTRAAMAKLKSARIAAAPSDCVKTEYVKDWRLFTSEEVKNYQSEYEAGFAKVVPVHSAPFHLLTSTLPVIGCMSDMELERARRMLRLVTANLLLACDLPPYQRPGIVERLPRVPPVLPTIRDIEPQSLFAPGDDGYFAPRAASSLPSATETCEWLSTTPWLVNESVRTASFLQSFDRVAARRAIAETFLALRAWKLTHGEYPDGLAELIDAELKTLPIDPWSGKPLGLIRASGQVLKHAGPNDVPYETRPSDRLLYSVGPDGVDQKASIESAFGQGRGDWIFLLP